MAIMNKDMEAQLREFFNTVQIQFVHKDGSVRLRDGTIVTPAPEKRQEDQPYHSKYSVENFDEELQNSKLSFSIPEDCDGENLYLNLEENK